MKKNGFTLLELIIVISLIALLAAAGLALINPKRQIEKSWDTRRKNDLSQLQKVFEDFYNDKNCYPKPDEVCYNSVAGQTFCNICGTKNPPSNFADLSPYLSRLPCDPQQTILPFYYLVNNTSCPSVYRVYTKLSNQFDPAIAAVGCSGGCGPGLSYNYGIASPNSGL